MAFGKCPRCPQSARSGLLIGGECAYHYGGGGEVERNSAPAIEKAKLLAAKTKTQDVWFKEMIAKRPANCENCGKMIVIPKDVTPKAAIAHILPKKLFKSVSKNDFNWVALCMPCHSDFDNRGHDKASSMPVAKIAKQRFELFKDCISEDEKKHIPDYLLHRQAGTN